MRDHKQAWRAARMGWEKTTLRKVLDRYPERKKRFETSSGIPVERLYTPEDTVDLNYTEKLGFAGEYPFTRGVQPTMYRGRFWTMRQYAGFGTAEESNQRYRHLLAQGQTGLSVAFDLPTQMGYDSDHPLVAGEVGRAGVTIDSIDDMRTLFAEIPLDKVSVSLTINATAAVLLAFYIAVAEERGMAKLALAGTLQNDILKEYIARGTYVYPPAPSLRLVTDIIAYCKDAMPRWNPISISGYHIREAGATAAQELAFTLANGIAYVQAVVDRGMDVDEFAGRLSFFFNAHNHLFEEVAKFRAARRLWANIMKHRFKARKDRSCMLRFHTQTAGSTLTAQQPDNNVVRVTLQALAAVLGGTQSLHTNARDEALSLPTEHAATLALRTQQVIAYESGAADTVDPLAGSYYIEALTDQIEARAQAYLDQIDRLGGALQAIEQGYFQREIHNSAYAYQKRVESGEEVVVGVNRFQTEEQTSIAVLRLDPAIEKRQVARLKAFRADRDQAVVWQALDELQRAAGGRANLMPYILAAVQKKATLGEICDALREVFGRYQPEVGF